MSTSLAMVLEGETRTIKDFRGAEDMRRHLQDPGSIKGEKVRIAGEGANGMILMARGVKIALSRGLASKVMAEN